MIDPGRAVDLAGAMRDLYGEAELEMVERVARRVERGIDQPGWAERKLAEVGALQRELDGVVARVDRDGAELLPELLAGAHRQGLAAAAAVVGDSFDLVRVNAGAVEALAAARLTGLQGTHFAILRSASDAYRSAVADASGLAVTGVYTRRDAAQAALRRFADAGVTGFVDARGRRWDLGSYTEMATRSAIAQSYLEAHVGALAGRGRDLVIVSDSPDECPRCRPWEGKVLSISGADPSRTSLAEARAGGLFHASCTHTLGLYVPGLTRPMRNTSDESGRRERAEQRTNERTIRRWKRRQAAAITDTERRLAAAKVAEWQARQRAFIAHTGRRRDYGRESLRHSTAQLRPPPLTHGTNDEGVAWAMSTWGPRRFSTAQREALQRYTEGGYSTINTHLRGLDMAAIAEFPEDVPAMIANAKRWTRSLDAVVAQHAVPEDVVVWRALGLDWQGLRDQPDVDGAVRALVGRTLEERGFMSTSVGAEPYLQREIVVRLTIPRGTPAYYAGRISVFPAERELLIARGRRYVVTGVERRGNQWWIDAEVL